MARGTCSVCHATYPGGERFCPIDGAAIVDPDATDPLIGKTIDDRYLVRRLIGRGGMGAVYEADHVGLDKRVAIKFMIEVDRDALARFRREARAASRISDEHVVQIFDVGTADDGREFIAMEYLDGRDLRTVMEAGPLAPARALAITRQMLHGLHAIHEAGIVHRDIKPGNILLVGDTDFVKIMDFGISTMDAGRTEHVTRSGQVIGTPQYMAPEQLAGEVIDGRADLYAVGITLYAMLTGDVPFSGTSMAEIASQQLHGEIPRVDAKRLGIPDHVAAAMSRALARSPMQRFGSALELAAALELADALDTPSRIGNAGSTVSARPQSASKPAPPTKHRSMVRQSFAWSRWHLLAAAVLASAVVTILVVVPSGHRRSVQLTDAAAAPDDPLAGARAAERDGRLELAIARYLERYDGHPDPELLFRIGELYERLDRAPDAVLHFQRYLDGAPDAKDRDAVRARITRLEAAPPALPPAPPLDARSGSDTRARRQPAPAVATCHCIADDTKTYRRWFMCATRYSPLCTCEDASNNPMCPVAWRTCTPPCPDSDISVNEEVFYKCPQPGYREFRVRAKPGEACHGFSTDGLPRHPVEHLELTAIDGKYRCDFCTASATADRSTNFVYHGKAGDPCAGYVMDDGSSIPGHLDCTPGE